MQTVKIADNIFEPASWREYETADVPKLLFDHFEGKWPSFARIYDQAVAQACDVTPHTEDDIERLNTLQGPLYVIVWPGEPLTIALVVVALVAVIAGVFLLMPKPANQNLKQPLQSPNNSLSDRQNQARVNGRINDIFGTVYCIFDELMVPLRKFINNVEYEISYLCAGRGTYSIDTVYDGDTNIATIPGSSVEIYGPNTSPNSGDAPQLTIGSAINELVRTVLRSNSIDGQELEPRLYKYRSDSSSLYFKSPNIIGCSNGSADFWNRFFDNGDDIVVVASTYTNGGTTIDLSGTYTVLDNSDNLLLTLDNPAASNADWNSLSGFPSSKTNDTQTVYIDGTALLHGTDHKSGYATIGPIVVGLPNFTGVILNLVALNGLFVVDNGNGKYIAQDVDVRVILQPCTSTGANAGPAHYYDYTVTGSTTPNQRALTIEIPFSSTTGFVKVSCQRLTDREYRSGYTPTDVLQWRDLYVVCDKVPSNFGNVTTVMCLTKATATALAVKERKLGAPVTRMIPKRVGTSGSTFSSTLYATNDMAEILSFICLDPYIGNRSTSEVDFDSIYSTSASIQTYFGSSKFSEFCYTFDDADQTFEQTVAAICSACFSIAYRQGQIKLTFERLNEDSVLLFNHRNKLPKSEQRSYSFGNQNNNDGVTIIYSDPNNNDAPAKIYFPSDQSAINPSEIQTVGVRNGAQAYMLGARAYNKIQYQHITTQFTALQQADMLVVSNRILVADNTRPDVQDGQIIAQNVRELTLSQNVTFQPATDYSLFIQHYDGTVEEIGVIAGSAANQVILSAAPRLPLAIGGDLYTQAAFQLVGDFDEDFRAFLVTAKTPKEKFTSEVTAINYDAKYYQNDGDYLTGKIDIDGTLLHGNELFNYIDFGI